MVSMAASRSLKKGSSIRPIVVSSDGWRRDMLTDGKQIRMLFFCVFVILRLLFTFKSEYQIRERAVDWVLAIA